MNGDPHLLIDLQVYSEYYFGIPNLKPLEVLKFFTKLGPQSYMYYGYGLPHPAEEVAFGKNYTKAQFKERYSAYRKFTNHRD